MSPLAHSQVLVVSKVLQEVLEVHQVVLQEVLEDHLMDRLASIRLVHPLVHPVCGSRVVCVVMVHRRHLGILV